jgi:predicted MFS family arabinose efflux permease
VGFQSYRDVLAVRDVRRVLLLAFFVRIPMWAGNIVLVLHVVSHLGRSYGAAGFLTSVATVALAVSGPWRGRRLDRVGLRAALTPSLVVLAACWSVAPFVAYWPLLVLVSLASLFVVPSFSIVRQSLIAAVPDAHRTTALSVDSVGTEISFMVGPALGVLLATAVPTQWALFGCEYASILGGVAIWLANPTLRSAVTSAESSETAAPPRRWLTPAVAAVLFASVATTVVLTGTDLGVVAALRGFGHQSWIGWELAVWGFGSAIGGVLYGALHRTIPVAVLLTLLAATTLPVALAHEAVLLAILLFVAGLFCAPTITATVDNLSRGFPERVRGEALGWHGSALTIGSAVGAPLAGVAIDHWGWRSSFVVCGLVGITAAAVLLATSHRRTSVSTEVASEPAAVG